jgi:hypothetical protein
MQVRHAPGPFDIVLTNLADLIRLPDERAAVLLDQRLAAFEKIDEIYERSYGERLNIVRQFETRKLWQYLGDPDTGLPFPNLTAWLSCSRFLGCRRVNFEAKRDGAMLADVEPQKLIDVPKGNIKVLTQLSTAVRNDPAVLEAARTMPQAKFEEKVEREHPTQHIVARKPMVFRLGRSDSRAVEDAIEWALEHDIAGSREEALVRMAEAALNEWKLDDELATMPAAEVEA